MNCNIEFDTLQNKIVTEGTSVTFIQWAFHLTTLAAGVYIFQRWAETTYLVESSWNVLAHGDAGRGSEGEAGEWSG
jgi:hypothetical protein